MAVAGAFGEGLKETVGADVLNENFWQRISNYLTKTTVEVTKLSGGLEASTPAKIIAGELKANVDIKAALKTAPSFRKKLNEFLSTRLSELKAEINKFVEESVKAARLANNKSDLPVVFLFDQFEQLRGSSTNERDVIQSVERIFKAHFDKLKLPSVHVIYTVPPWLHLMPGSLGIEILPCVRLRENDAPRTRYQSGWDHAKKILVKRFGEEGFKKIFGIQKIEDSSQVDNLIEMSGGHFRDLLRLVREAIVLIKTWRPNLPVSEDVIHRAILNVRNEYLPISNEDAKWLAKIEKTRSQALPDASPEKIAQLSLFLDSHWVLYLSNGQDWYDIHPLIRDEVKSIVANLK
jgi:hypothetical protein